MLLIIVSCALCLTVGYIVGVAFIGLPLLKMLHKEACGDEPFVFAAGKGVYAIKRVGELEVSKKEGD